MFDLYGDENAQNKILINLLRRDGVDFLTSNEAGKGGAPDNDQLEFCSQQQRVILTLDRGDFQRLHAEWMRSGRDHAGIIIVTRSVFWPPSVHLLIMRLQRERTPEQMRNAILFLSPTPTEEPP